MGALHKIKPAFFTKARDGGIREKRRFSDGGGLYLKTTETGAASWVFRFGLNGRETFMGGGSLRDVGLREARSWAADQRAVKEQGKDPHLERKREHKAIEAERARTTTFWDVAEEVLAPLDKRALNEKHKRQWRATLETYAKPVIGGKAIADIRRADVLRVVKPIWDDKRVTAQRVRQRVESVFDHAIAHELVDMNPARWLELKGSLAMHGGHQATHHAAMAWADVPAFVKALRKQAGLAARALELTIVTAVRTGEALGARWPEFDGDVWTIPAARMKGKPGHRRAHRVPLPRPAVDLVKALAKHPRGDFLFHGARSNKPLSGMSMLMLLRRMKRNDVTVHGFRSAFRDWCADNGHDREIAESSLAHVVQGVEGAYQRSDMLQRRRELMRAWARFCYGE